MQALRSSTGTLTVQSNTALQTMDAFAQVRPIHKPTLSRSSIACDLSIPLCVQQGHMP